MSYQESCHILQQLFFIERFNQKTTRNGLKLKWPCIWIRLIKIIVLFCIQQLLKCHMYIKTNHSFQKITRTWFNGESWRIMLNKMFWWKAVLLKSAGHVQQTYADVKQGVHYKLWYLRWIVRLRFSVGREPFLLPSFLSPH